MCTCVLYTLTFQNGKLVELDGLWHNKYVNSLWQMYNYNYLYMYNVHEHVMHGTSAINTCGTC